MSCIEYFYYLKAKIAIIIDITIATTVQAIAIV